MVLEELKQKVFSLTQSIELKDQLIIYLQGDLEAADKRFLQ